MPKRYPAVGYFWQDNDGVHNLWAGFDAVRGLSGAETGAFLRQREGLFFAVFFQNTQDIGADIRVVF
jgi:hypothetical protein